MTNSNLTLLVPVYLPISVVAKRRVQDFDVSREQARVADQSARKKKRETSQQLGIFRSEFHHMPLTLAQ